MAIYNGNQKIDVSGVDKVYVGTQLVYQNAGWRELWSGNATISKGGSQVNIQDPAFSTLTGTTQLRITFTMSGSGGTLSYYDNGVSVSTAPTSPLELTADLTGNKNELVGIKVTSGSNIIILALGWSGYTYKYFRLSYSRSGSVDSLRATLTVTKIEAYM